jgi:ERCC4-type nuclease
MKHVLLIIDKAEKTASRKVDATDLPNLWASVPVNYQVALGPLPVGDVWIYVRDDAPFNVPEKWKFTALEPSWPTTALNAPVMDDYFLPPAAPDSAPMAISSPDVASAEGPKRPEVVLEEFPPPHPNIMVERKALSDLKSSYGDGRYKDQKMRLMNCDAELVVLLVEGYNGQKVNDQSLKTRYLSTFVHCMFRDNIPVYHTQNIRDSFEFLHHLASEMAAGKMVRTADYMERTKYTDNIQMARKSNLTSERGLELQLASIPGISAKMARAVVDVYPTMMDLCRAYEKLADDVEDEAEEVERRRHNLLSELTFRGTSSGKEQRLASRSSKIYQYLSGQGEAPPPKKRAKKTGKAKGKTINL